MSLHELKSLDSYLNQNEINLLSSNGVVFQVGFLYDSIIDAFFYVIIKNQNAFAVPCFATV